ncbi:hypothetical protein [Pseudomonas purpurea]|uniref:hypothetical protein n=1 Tax=Pseudomonas purpurea TaxID=3136737 RepID=UPI0032654643
MNGHTNPSFDEAMPLGASDAQFINDLHELLERYGNQDRFGLCLLHDHFAVAEDEILLECNDHNARTLHLDVVKRGALPESKFTSWRIGGPRAEALTACAMDKCKVEALTACAMDKCKVEALTACAMDKCKVEALTACAMDKCKVEALTACAMDKCKVEALTACAMDKCK